MSNYFNQQKRIAFLSVYSSTVPLAKKEKISDEFLIEFCFETVEKLFEKYPYENGKTEIKNSEEAPF